MFLPFPPDTLSLAEATGAFASQESKRIPEIILKRLAPGEWGSCPVPGARGEAPPLPVPRCWTCGAQAKPWKGWDWREGGPRGGDGGKGGRQANLFH